MKVGVGDRKRRGLKIVIRVLHHSVVVVVLLEALDSTREDVEAASGKEKGTSCEATTAALAFLLEF